MEEFLKKCGDGFFSEAKAEGYAPLNLAYIGDAVFDILVRSKVMAGGSRPVNELSRQASSFVKAASQSAMYHKIEDKLTEEEMSVMRRGRNAKTFTRAKNASVTEYHHATGLEALFGYLYIKGNIDRILELFGMCVE